MKNQNIFKGQLVMNSVFVDWLADESAVGGTITAIEDDVFEFEIADQTVHVTNNTVDIPGMGVCISDAAIFDKIMSSLAIGQEMRIGSGQWTFYSEPNEVRFIISERSVV